MTARAARPFASVAELVERLPDLPRDVLLRLAESGAFNALDLQPAGAAQERRDRRRGNLWQVLGAARRRGRHAPLALEAPEAEAPFNPLDRFAAIAWDYTATGHSTRGHPLAPLRRRLAARDLPSAGQVAAMEHGRQVSYAGLVICRQRPGTAAGVVFMTLEDETGFVNLVVWAKVFERFRSTILSASFLGVSGTIQSQHNVVHIIAARFWTMELSAEPPAESAAGRNGAPAGTSRPLPVRSHDFH